MPLLVTVTLELHRHVQTVFEKARTLTHTVEVAFANIPGECFFWRIAGVGHCATAWFVTPVSQAISTGLDCILELPFVIILGQIFPWQGVTLESALNLLFLFGMRKIISLLAPYAWGSSSTGAEPHPPIPIAVCISM